MQTDPTPPNRPGTIAVLGASTARHKFGNKCVRAYVHAGWEVYPINPRGGEIEGLQVYERLADIGADLDRIGVYLPPPVTLTLLAEMADKGAGEIWFNPGSADHQVLEAARAADLQAMDGCAIVDIGLSPSQFP
jgi:predicted CoA-binding protein